MCPFCVKCLLKYDVLSVATGTIILSQARSHWIEIFSRHMCFHQRHFLVVTGVKLTYIKGGPGPPCPSSGPTLDFIKYFA